MELKYSKIVDREKKKAEMLLYGSIGEKVDGDYFAQELNWLTKHYDEITIKINSYGGLVDQGLSIVSEMKSASAYIITHVVGIAGSMSGVIAVAGDECRMNDYARLMLHSPYFVDKDGKEVKKLSQKAKKSLKAIKGILISILTNSGKDKENIDKILTEETWYDAEEAKDEGFVREIIDTKRKDLAALEPLKLVAKVMEEVEPKNSNKSMKKIAAHYDLDPNANEDQILVKIEESETATTKKMVDQLIAIGEKIGTITDENKEKVERLAKADFELAIEMYLPADKIGVSADGDDEEKGGGDGKKTLIKDLIKGGKKDKKAEPTAKKFDEYTEDELDKLRDEDRPAYVAVYEAHFGFEPEIED